MSHLSGLLGLAFVVSELTLAGRRRSTRLTGASQKDGGSLRLLWRVITAAIVLGVLLASFNIGPRLPAGVPWGTISLVLFIGGTAIRWWAITYLGRFFTVDVAVVADHRLVTGGPYRWVRHPSYTGLMLQFLALSLALNHLVSLCVIMVPVFLALSQRMRVEEGVLQANFGGDYEAYSARTRRLVPLVY